MSSLGPGALAGIGLACFFVILVLFAGTGVDKSSPSGENIGVQSAGGGGRKSRKSTKTTKTTKSTKSTKTTKTKK